MSNIDPNISNLLRTGREAVPGWITLELIDKTMRLWSKRSGVPVSAEEAVGILLRVGTLLDVLTQQ